MTEDFQAIRQLAEAGKLGRIVRSKSAYDRFLPTGSSPAPGASHSGPAADPV